MLWMWVALIVGFVLGALATYFYLRAKRVTPDTPSTHAPTLLQTPRDAQTTVAAEVRQLDFLIPDSCFIEVDGARIHYVQAGAGQDVVLIHGIGASVFIWRYLFPLLQSRYRVTAIDLPGFGRSSKEPNRNYGLDAQTEITAKTLELLGIKKAYIVGSSMGGAIALWLAKRYPQTFPHVVTLAPATDPSLVPLSVHSFAAAAPYFRKALNRRTMRLLLDRVMARKDLITDDVIDAYLEPFNDTGEAHRAFWAATSLLRDRRLPRDLNDVRANVLIIYGTRDLLVPRRSIERLVGVLPQGELLIHEEGGHHIMEDEPEWLADTLKSYFSSHPL